MTPFAALWLAWLGYWIVAAQNTKTTQRRETRGSRIGHVLLSFLAAVLLAFRNLPVPWLNERFVPETMATYWAGLLMVLVGLAFAVWARRTLGRNWSGTVTVKQDHELIRTGPYRYVRHPIYSGILLAVLGTAVAFGEWRGLLAFILLTASLLLKVRMEERFMSENFPNEYPRYRAEVPALIPFLPHLGPTQYL